MLVLLPRRTARFLPDVHAGDKRAEGRFKKIRF